MSRVVTFGEIMVRLATPGHRRFRQAMPGKLEASFAGAEASIAASIAYLGGEAAFVTALPDHAIAEACLSDLRSLGVDTRHIARTTGGRLGVYYLERGASQRSSQVIYDREGSSVAVTPAAAYDWSEILDLAAWLVISGVTPALSRTAAEVTQQAMQEAGRRGVRVACDVNYRHKLWRWDPELPPRRLAFRTLRQLLPLANLFVGSAEDVRWLLELESVPTPLDAAHRLADAFPGMEHVALTRRQPGSATRTGFWGGLYDRARDELWQVPADGQWQPIDFVVDRIGTGDAFTAGLLFALTTPELASPAVAIRFAVAAACLSHAIEGDFNCTTRAEIESLMAGEVGGGVDR